MAKVIAPAMSAQASGRVGAVWFVPCVSRTSAGRRSCEHISCNTSQQNSRARFKTVHDAWRGLSAAQVATWAAAAGSAAAARAKFIGNNCRLLSVGSAIALDYLPTGLAAQELGQDHEQPDYGIPIFDHFLPQAVQAGAAVRLSAAISTLRRSAIDRRKFRQSGLAQAGATILTWTLPFIPAVIFVTIDQIDTTNGDLLFSDTYAPPINWTLPAAPRRRR